MTKKKDTITKLSDAELSKLVVESRISLREERFAAAGARPKDSNGPRKLRKKIAQILTEQHARTLRGDAK